MVGEVQFALASQPPPDATVIAASTPMLAGRRAGHVVKCCCPRAACCALCCRLPAGAIDSTEVQGLLLGLQLAGDGATTTTTVDRDTLDYWFKEFDVNADRSITFDEFTSALGRWVDEKMAAHAGGTGPGSVRFSDMLDPRQGGAAATVLADLPADDLAALQVGATGLVGGWWPCGRVLLLLA